MQLTLVLLITCLLINKVFNPSLLHRKILNLYILFNSTIVAISLYNPYDLYVVQPYTAFILCLMFTFFTLGYLLYSARCDLIKKLKVNEIKSQWTKWYKYLTYIICPLVLFYAAKYFLYMQNADLANSRLARYYSGAVFSNGYEILFYNIMVAMFMIFIQLYIVTAILSKSKKSFVYYLSVLSFLGWISFGAGRTSLIEIAVYTIFVAIAFDCKILNKHNFFYLCILGVISTILTLFRSVQTEDWNFSALYYSFLEMVKQGVTYFTGSFVTLQYALNHGDEYGFYSYGAMTFSAIDELLSYLLMILNRDFVPHIYSVSENINKNIEIADGYEQNALYTASFYFFSDFGILGVAFFSFLFGAIFAKSIYLLMRYNSLYLLIACSVMFYTSIVMTLTWKLASIEYFFTVVICLLLFNSKLNKII